MRAYVERQSCDPAARYAEGYVVTQPARGPSARYVDYVDSFMDRDSPPSRYADAYVERQAAEEPTARQLKFKRFSSLDAEAYDETPVRSKSAPRSSGLSRERPLVSAGRDDQDWSWWDEEEEEWGRFLQRTGGKKKWSAVAREQAGSSSSTAAAAAPGRRSRSAASTSRVTVDTSPEPTPPKKAGSRSLRSYVDDDDEEEDFLRSSRRARSSRPPKAAGVEVSSPPSPPFVPRGKLLRSVAPEDAETEDAMEENYYARSRKPTRKALRRSDAEDEALEPVGTVETVTMTPPFQNVGAAPAGGSSGFMPPCAAIPGPQRPPTAMFGAARPMMPGAAPQCHQLPPGFVPPPAPQCQWGSSFPSQLPAQQQPQQFAGAGFMPHSAPMLPQCHGGCMPPVTTSTVIPGSMAGMPLGWGAPPPPQSPRPGGSLQAPPAPSPLMPLAPGCPASPPLTPRSTSPGPAGLCCPLSPVTAPASAAPMPPMCSVAPGGPTPCATSMMAPPPSLAAWGGQAPPPGQPPLPFVSPLPPMNSMACPRPPAMMPAVESCSQPCGCSTCCSAAPAAMTGSGTSSSSLLAPPTFNPQQLHQMQPQPWPLQPSPPTLSPSMPYATMTTAVPGAPYGASMVAPPPSAQAYYPSGLPKLYPDWIGTFGPGNGPQVAAPHAAAPPPPPPPPYHDSHEPPLNVHEGDHDHHHHSGGTSTRGLHSDLRETLDGFMGRMMGSDLGSRLA